MTKFSAQQQSQLAQIGVFLRETREQQGKSLEDIAIRTYIRPQLLNGIESGDPDLLPEPIFVQGFIRRYAENLGLKGTDLAQQFSVDSIPSTPRPVRQSVPEDSPTTRLTRLSTETSAVDKSATKETATGAAMFSAGSSSPLEDSLISASGQEAETAELATARQSQTPTDVPLIVDDAVLDMQAAQVESTAATPVEPVEPVQADSGSDFQKLLDDAAVDKSNADGFGSDSFFGTETLTGATVGNTTLPTSDLPTADLPDAEDTFASKVAEFDRENLAAASTLETSEIETSEIEISEIEISKTETPSAAPTISNSSFNDDLPAAFTTAAPTPVATPTSTATPTYVDPSPVGVEYARPEGPNLKPFVIGGVVAALLTAAVVALASLFGGGDRTPAVADSPNEEPAAAELETVGTETLPPIPDEAAASPASTAPIYVEAEATAEAWVSVIADGTPLFEGTLQPGDTVVWEGQELINVYSGDAGALALSQNGESATVMGERGQPEEKIFTLN